MTVRPSFMEDAMKVDRELMALLKAVKKASTSPAIIIDRICRNGRFVEKTSDEVGNPPSPSVEVAPS